MPSFMTKLPVGAIALAFSLVSCGNSRPVQCQRLMGVVNQHQTYTQELEAQIQKSSSRAASVENLEDVVTVAQQYTTAVDQVVTDLNALATDLDRANLGDPTLRQFKTQYIELVQGFTEALGEASAAMALVSNAKSETDLPALFQQSQVKTIAAVQAIEQLASREAELIENANTYCAVSGDEEPDSPEQPTSEE